jgi:hypothetical protein
VEKGLNLDFQKQIFLMDDNQPTLPVQDNPSFRKTSQIIWMWTLLRALNRHPEGTGEKILR